MSEVGRVAGWALWPWLSCLGIVGLVGAPARSTAQPTLRIRAETRIELQVAPAPRGVRVELTLRDDLGAGIAGAEVSLTLVAPGHTQAQRVRTGNDGAFEGVIPAPFPVAEVEVRYAGDRGHAATEAALAVRAGRVATELTLSVEGGARMDLDSPRHRLRCSARSSNGGDGLTVELFDELGRRLARGTTDVQGELIWELPSAALGTVGAGRLIARTEGDERRAEAQTELPIVRTRSTRVELAEPPAELEAGRPIALSGRLLDSRGGLGRRAVGIYRDGAHWLTVLTDARGAFSLERALPPEVEGEVTLEARFQSDGPGRPGARSPQRTVRVLKPTSYAWLVLLGVCALLGLAVAWGTRRRSPQAPSAPLEVPPSHVVLVGRGGRRRRFDVAGRVVDGRDSTPIADAEVRLEGDGRPRPAVVQTDGDGRFALERVPAGEWRLVVDAEGYELAQAALRAPHGGQWSRAQVRLRSLRWKASGALEELGAALMGSRQRAASATAREVAGAAPAPLAAEASALPTEVERVAYAREQPRREQVEEIVERAGSLRERVTDQTAR